MIKEKAESTNQLVNSVLNGIQEVKGNDIKYLDLRKLNNSICDYFVICHGNSPTQVKAIANKIQEETEKVLHEIPWKVQGYENAQWILLDYVDVVVHVFHKDARAFYNLEELWADAETNEIVYQV